MTRSRSRQRRGGRLLGSVLLGSVLLGCSGENEALFGATPMLNQQPAMPPPPEMPSLPPLEPLEPPAVPAVMPMPPPSVPPPSSTSAPRPVQPEPAPAEPVPAEPAPCTAFGPFAAPEPITGLGMTAPTTGPVFAADGLTLLFSARDPDESIFSASRARGSAEFSPAQPVPNLDAGGTEEGTPFLSFDGLSLYFFSTRPGPGVQGDRDIWIARRPSLDAPFEEPTVLPAVNSPDLEHLPRLSRDELSIAFVSGRDDTPNGASNLWVAQRAVRSDDFSAAVEVPGINTAAREEGFSFSADGLTLFFASNRVDLAHMELFVAVRADADATFSTPELLGDLNSGSQELDPQLSPDGLELFFASDRGGTFQLFRSVRECLAR